MKRREKTPSCLFRLLGVHSKVIALREFLYR